MACLGKSFWILAVMMRTNKEDTPRVKGLHMNKFIKSMFCFALCIAGLLIFMKKDLYANDNYSIAKELETSFVQVRYYLKYHKGKAPTMKGYLCPNCHQIHGRDGRGHIKEDRPLIVPGYVLAPNRVVSANLYISAEYIKKITIKFGQREQKAGIEAYAISQPAIFIKTDIKCKSSGFFSDRGRCCTHLWKSFGNDFHSKCEGSA